MRMRGRGSLLFRTTPYHDRPPLKSLTFVQSFIQCYQCFMSDFVFYPHLMFLILSQTYRTLSSEVADDLHSTPSDLSYDKTEEDIYEVPLLVPHPSAPPCSDEDQFKYNMAGSGLAFKWNNTLHHNNNTPQHVNNTPYNNNIWSNGWKKKEGDKQLKRHRRSKSADLAGSEVKVQRKSSPFSSPFNRHSSQGWRSSLFSRHAWRGCWGGSFETGG